MHVMKPNVIWRDSRVTAIQSDKHVVHKVSDKHSAKSFQDLGNNLQISDHKLL